MNDRARNLFELSPRPIITKGAPGRPAPDLGARVVRLARIAAVIHFAKLADAERRAAPVRWSSQGESA